MWTEELRRGATAAGLSGTRTRLFGSLPERTDDAIVKGLIAVLLLVRDLGLGLDNVPELENVVLDPGNVDRAGYVVGTRHLLDVGLELANDFGIDDVALCADLVVRGGRESHWEESKP